MKFNVGTQNIRPNINKRDVQRIARLVNTYTDAILFQEINEESTLLALEEYLCPKGWLFYGRQHKNPIAIRKEILQLASERSLPGGYNKRQYFKWHGGYPELDLRERGEFRIIVQGEDTKPFILSNGHLVPRRIQETHPSLWREAVEDWTWTVNTARRHGLSVIWGGDFNATTRKVGRFNTVQATVATSGKIDHIFVAKGRLKAPEISKSGKPSILDTPSDHPLVVGTVHVGV